MSLPVMLYSAVLIAGFLPFCWIKALKSESYLLTTCILNAAFVYLLILIIRGS